MILEFKKFALRGSVIDLAIGIVIGASFNQIVNSIVNDIIMPPIGFLLGNVDFSELYITLGSESYESLSLAKAAGAPTINYGIFINITISFVITAFAVFLLVKFINRLRERNDKKEEISKPKTKDCPFCFSSINLKAIKCPNCTSKL